MNTDPQTQTPAQPQAKMHASVSYSMKLIGVGRPALLELTYDDRIRLFSTQPEASQATGAVSGPSLIFDVPVKEIEKVGGSMTTLTLRVAGKRYIVQMGNPMFTPAAAGSVDGLVATSRLAKSSGVYKWVDAFKAQNVKVSFWKMGRLYAVSMLAALVIMVAIAIIAVQLEK
jgi:hypothetical protein